jgi:beta-N-acetylhexosaminidase
MALAHDIPPAGRFVMVDIAGTALDTGQAAFLRENHIRAVCLFRRNLGSEAGIRALTAALRETLGDDALIAIDQEGGSVVRATCLPQAPAAMALGACGDASLAEEVGEAVGRGLRALGFNWNFAPVLDVNNNPANPVIAERSFSGDPAEVARLAGAWMRGALRAGVACCVKHFPGHGDTHIDSHFALPVVDKPAAALQALELLPFERLLPAAPAVMTAHIVYPQLDAEHPATLSRKVLGGLLRERLRYDGVVITDSLVMRAIHERYGHDRAAVLALRAGADMAMALGTREEQLAAVRAIAAAQRDGALDAQALHHSNARLDALARRFPAAALDDGAAQRRADDKLMRTAWSRGLTGVAQQGRSPQPPAIGAPLRVLTQASVPSDGVSEAGPSAAQVAQLFDGFRDVEWIEMPNLCEFDASRLPRDGRTLVLASNHRERYPAAACTWPIGLHLALWNPFQVLDIAAPAVVSWGYADGAMAALRAWLHGAQDLPGHPPVRLDVPASQP